MFPDIHVCRRYLKVVKRFGFCYNFQLLEISFNLRADFFLTRLETALNYSNSLHLIFSSCSLH